MKINNLSTCTNTNTKKQMDVWNAYLLQGATYSQNDFPICPTTATHIPKQLISYREAITMHNHEFNNKNYNYKYDAFIHFWIDDFKFDGIKEGIWVKPQNLLDLASHFSGIITPDFSTYADFPNPLCIWNTYRMRALGYWIGKNGIPVINNVRWGNINTWDYCFEGIEPNSIIAIGVSASNPRIINNRPLFDAGFLELIKRLSPTDIIIYGGNNYPLFKSPIVSNINIHKFKSQCELSHKGEKTYE